MHTLHIYNLSYQHPDGHVQFKQLNFSINEKITAIIGANGSGKSILVNILANHIQPSAGRVEFSGTRLFVSQQLCDHYLQDSSNTIAQQLGIDKKLAALTRITHGSIADADFALVGDDWLCEQYYQQQLSGIGINAPINTPITQLSPGQQRCLTLYCALAAKPDLLILDEPSNHLDRAAKQWLISQLHIFGGQVIIVSHDCQLLDHSDAIIELNNQGYHYETGNFTHFCQQKELQQTALTKQINHLAKEQKKHQQQTQINHEKAQQRAAQGNKHRRSTSQAKVMLDFNKNKAQASKGANERLASTKLNNLAQQQRALRKQQPHKIESNLTFTQSTSKKRLLFIDKLCLPYGCIQTPVTLIINSGDKLHIDGLNGSGKSTLLRMINETPSSYLSTTIQLNTQVLYIDQHCSFLNANHSLIEALTFHCELKLETVRNILAGIGFKGIDVFKLISQLSGGEKMQIAMLIAAQKAAECLLLLDEPDNHLDLANKQHLAKNLTDFTGSFILVSHDEVFVEQCHVTQQLSLH
ncbi:ATP-binding cassette domain-containing protein [Pseudoalteromonas atlantica]|uniref:ATP-binding cassette domain-containing protein n=1 Tax=Pseudoalteromonas atlantica TaxID=288 RepID=UPI00373676BD